MGPVVVDVQEPEDHLAVEERRRAQGVEALLDDRRPDRRAARIVGVARREHRPAGGDRQAGQGRHGELADRREVGRRQAPADGRHDLAVGAAQEDRRAVGLEQDRGVVDEAGQRLVQVELAADVAGDPAQGVEPMDLLGGFLEQPGGVDRGRELAGDGVEERDVELRQGGRVRRADDEGAPEMRGEGDRQRDLDRRSGVDRLPPVRAFPGQDRPFLADGSSDRAVTSPAGPSPGRVRCRASRAARAVRRGARRRRRCRRGTTRAEAPPPSRASARCHGPRK